MAVFAAATRAEDGARIWNGKWLCHDVFSPAKMVISPAKMVMSPRKIW
jgi:hypothetical protein